MNIDKKKVMQYSITFVILGFTGVAALWAAKLFLIKTIVKKDASANKDVLEKMNVKELYELYNLLPVKVKDATTTEPKGLLSAISLFSQKIKEKKQKT
jgi:hypothetical protein